MPTITGDAVKEQTLLLGNGRVAAEIASTLLSRKIPVTLVTSDITDSSWTHSLTLHPCAHLFQAFTQTQPYRFSGSAGDFRVVLTSENPSHPQRMPLTCSTVVIAEDAVRKPNYSLYGLIPSPCVLSISDIAEMIETYSSETYGSFSGKTAVFLLGLAEDSYPQETETVMQCCLKLQTEWGMKSFILTRNLKVAAFGLEVLYRKTREAGVTYVKFSNDCPRFQQNADGQVTLSFLDEITRLPFTLQADITVVDETILPSPRLKELSGIFKLNLNPEGFVQADNVRRLSIFTHRKGILAAGASRGIQPLSAQLADSQEIALAVLSLANGSLTAPGAKAEIDTGACVRCLTCFRICPYQAISLNTHPVTIPDACERCGICAAECPRKAIHIDDLQTGSFSHRLQPPLLQSESASFIPFIAAFCCSRSAGRAKELAGQAGLPLPERLSVIEVPCSGSVSIEHLMAAFQNQADGVLVLTCHEGNCHSEYGNILARRRIVMFQNLLERIGIPPERLLLKTLAANMPADFSATALQFEKRIAEAGPLYKGKYRHSEK